MTALSERKEPVIAFGPPKVSAAFSKQIIRAPRNAPSGDLTRSIRRKQARGRFEALCQSMALSEDVSETLSAALLSGDEVGGDGEAIAKALRCVFDFEPVAEATAHPLVLVGGSAPMRRRVALAMAQRMEWAGRRVALYCLRNRRFPTPLAIYSGGLDILHVGSVEACVDAVNARDPGDLAIIDASCLDGDEAGTNALAMLSLALNAEAVYVADAGTPFPERDHVAGVERLVVAGRCDPERFGAIFDLAYRWGWAFAGHYSATGIYRQMTPGALFDRIALPVP